MKKLAMILFTLFLTVNAFGAFGYKITEAPSDKTFRIKAQTLLDQAQALLPFSLKSAIGKSIEVRFASLASRQGAMGYYSRGVLTLDLKTIPEILKGESAATPLMRTHKTLYREILATILHETVHAYDQLNLHDRAEENLIRACRDESRNRKENMERPECSFYKNMNKSFSQNPYFALAAGFVYEKTSWFKQRSPDAYELSDVTESLAVNMEYFLLDPEFACRRPTLYGLLQSKFQHTPFKINCQNSLSYLVPGYGPGEEPVTKIDPRRVYQIHYLLAGDGNDVSSGFGHTMYRVIVCAPTRIVVGPDCLNDIDQHLVLTFRALVNTPQIDTIKGLKGDYPSRLFIIPFYQAIDEYNRTELRDLKSVPLNLSRQEIERFLVRSVETHWSYDGKYYYISNNCAVESLNLLRTALPRPELLQIDSVTPNGLYRALERVGLLNTPRFDSRKEAINAGYIFDSYRDRYESAYQILKTSLQLPQKYFADFLKVPVLARKHIYSRFASLSGELRVKSAAAAMLLEGASQKMLLAELNRDLVERGFANDTGTRVRVEKMSRLEFYFSQPSALLQGTGGYGLPTDAELKTLYDRATQLQTEGMALTEQLAKDGETLGRPDLINDFENSRKNTQFVMSFLKSVI